MSSDARVRIRLSSVIENCLHVIDCPIDDWPILFAGTEKPPAGRKSVPDDLILPNGGTWMEYQEQQTPAVGYAFHPVL